MMIQDISIITIALGSILLLAGRKLFWIFIGLGGVLAGLDFGRNVFIGQPLLFVLAAAVICALLGIFLAFIFQEFIIVLAGVITGGVMAVHWSTFFVIYEPFSMFNLLMFSLGALFGGVFMVLAFDAALIILSCLLGGILIVSTIPGDGLIKLMAVLFFVCIGIYFQSNFFQENRNHSKNLI